MADQNIFIYIVITKSVQRRRSPNQPTKGYSNKDKVMGTGYRYSSVYRSTNVEKTEVHQYI
jgi:hypothetical protein